MACAVADLWKAVPRERQHHSLQQKNQTPQGAIKNGESSSYRILAEKTSAAWAAKVPPTARLERIGSGKMIPTDDPGWSR